MDIAIGLPNLIPDTPGRLLVDWSVRAEQAGFSSLVTTDRIVYPGYDPLLTLAVAAGATSRIKLVTDVIVTPLRDPVTLARDAASVYTISEGRLLLGIAPGVRPDDFAVVNRDHGDRFQRFESELAVMHQVWAGHPPEGGDRSPLAWPVPEGGVPLILGGFSDGAIDRVIRWGTGWAAPSLAPDDVFAFADKVRAAWRERGRSGEPRIIAMVRFGLGADVAELSRETARDDFAILGPELAAVFGEDAMHTAGDVQATIRKYADAGIDELVFNPTVPQLSQVDRLAEAAL